MPTRTKPRSPTPLAAILQGKLGKVKNSEDLLTSITFGTLSWLPPALGFRPLFALLNPAPAWIPSVVRTEVELWPWWDHAEDESGAEPDVVMTLHRSTGPPLLLLVECKRKSGLGHNQLVRQAASARVVAAQRSAEFAGLIYLTEHTGPPPELPREQSRLGDLPLWWMSWRDFWPIFETAERELKGVSPLMAATAHDASACLKRWGLVRFQGWSPVRSFPAVSLPSRSR